MAVARLGEVRDVSFLRELAYLSRHAWVSFKETTGLSRRTDRTFYIDRFVRALRSGALGRDYKILATGKNDGAGSQAQAAMSAICFAEAFGLEYVHRPFSSMLYELQVPANQLAPCPGPERRSTTYVGAPLTPDWIEQWEDYFNLGFGARRLSGCAGPVVPLDALLIAPDKWPQDAIVAAPHYLHYCNQDAQSWERVLPTLRKNYRRTKPQRAGAGFTVAIHMRRGTITPEIKKFAPNFTPDATFANALASVLEIVSAKVSNPSIKLFSQGGPQQFAEFARFGCELHLDESPIDTHSQLVDADVLIMSKGAFSYTAGVLNEGITLYDPQKYRPLEDWIVRAHDGSFDNRLFCERLEAHLARKNLKVLGALTSAEHEVSVSPIA